MFYDKQDGNSTRLSLQILPADGSLVGSESWLQFNTSQQAMHGYPPLEMDFQYSPQEFVLSARDCGGLTAWQSFTMELLKPLFTVQTQEQLLLVPEEEKGGFAPGEALPLPELQQPQSHHTDSSAAQLHTHLLVQELASQLVIFTVFQFRTEHTWPTPDKEAVAKAEYKWNRQRERLMKGQNYNPVKVQTGKYTSSWCWWEWGVTVSAEEISFHYFTRRGRTVTQGSSQNMMAPFKFRGATILEALGHLGILEFFLNAWHFLCPSFKTFWSVSINTS